MIGRGQAPVRGPWRPGVPVWSARGDAVASRGVLAVPAGSAVVVSAGPEGQRVVCGPAEVPVESQAEVVGVSLVPFEVAFACGGLTAGDGFPVRLDVRAVVAAVPHVAEVAALRGRVLSAARGGEAIQGAHVEQIGAMVGQACRSALQECVGRLEALALIRGEHRETLREAVRKALQRWCFEAGLSLAGEPQVAVASSAAQQEAVVQARARWEARRVERLRELEAAWQRVRREGLRELEAVLERLVGLVSSHPGEGVESLLRMLPAEHREVVLGYLLSRPGRQAEATLCVPAGGELLLFAWSEGGREPRRVRLDAHQGGVRSVRCVGEDGGRVLLGVGARRWVYVVDAETGAVLRELEMLPDRAPVRGGFNSVALNGADVWASHSELGLIVWPAASPDAPRHVLADWTRGARTVRGVRVGDGWLWVAIDSEVVQVPLDEPEARHARRYAGSRAPITAFDVEGGELLAGNSEGQILAWPWSEPQRPRLVRHLSGAVESLVRVRGPVIDRLVVADGGPAALALSELGAAQVAYEGGGGRIRRVAAGDEVVAGLTVGRERLVVWRADQPGEPVWSVSLLGLTGHRGQDLCIMSRVSCGAARR